MKMPKNFKKIWLPLFLLAAALIVVYKTVDKLPEVFSAIGTFLGFFGTIFAAVVIAFILYIPQGKFEKLFLKLKPENFFHKHARGFSVLITYLLLCVLLGVGLYFIIPLLIKNVGKLIENTPQYYKSLLGFIDSLADKNGMIFGIISAEELKQICSLENILKAVDLNKFSTYLDGIMKFGSGFLNFFLSAALSIYFLLDHEKIILTGGKVLNLIFKKRTLYAVYSYVARGCEIFYDYLYGAILDALLVGLELSLAFYIIGVPYAILLGIFAGLCNIIPYFGAIIAAVVACLFCYITTGNIWTVLIMLAVIIAIQQIDGNFVQPRIVGQKVGVKPVYVLCAIIIGGAMFGFVGILVAVPTFAFIRMIILDIIEAKKDREAVTVTADGQSLEQPGEPTAKQEDEPQDENPDGAQR
ncbi:MAG: AI-2E family transporter [Oscillospiraceae bacterium]|nr:AI-2E family transporter [Candidatus Equicaccousia limihippi]